MNRIRLRGSPVYEFNDQDFFDNRREISLIEVIGFGIPAKETLGVRWRFLNKTFDHAPGFGRVLDDLRLNWESMETDLKLDLSGIRTQILVPVRIFAPS